MVSQVPLKGSFNGDLDTGIAIYKYGYINSNMAASLNGFRVFLVDVGQVLVDILLFL